MVSFLKAQRSPWTVLVAGCWLEAVSGLSYVYSTYSGVLKSQLLYNQRQINALAVAKDLGDHVGLAAGFLSGILPDWALPLLGSVLILGGYGVLWLFVGSIITGIPFWLVCIIIFLGTNGSTYLDTAALVVCLSNFPSNRASAVGLLKGFKGLSGAIYNQIYASFLTPDQTAFILFIALVPVGVVGPLILMMGLSVNTSVANDNGNSNSQILFGVSLLLAAYMLVVTLLQDLCNISRGINVLFTVLLFCILLLPLVIIKLRDSFNKDHVKGDLQSGKVVLQDGSSKDDDEGMRTPKMYAEVGEMPNTSSIFEENSDGQNIEEQKLLQGSNQVPLLDPSDYTVWNALKNANFWLLVASIFFGMGTGTTAFDNLRQVAQAQGYENVEVFVSLANIFNFLGRIGGGYISEACTRRYGHPRALVLALSQVVMAVGHLVLALALPGTIYAAVFFIATGFGSQWAVFPTATSELFGLRNFGVLYNLVAIASPAGSIIYSTFMAGPIYDWQASKQGSSSCEGTVCFEITFFAMAAACILATALSIVLSARTRFLYAATRHALR